MMKARIAVIEDDNDLREVICLMLQCAGHEVAGFSNALEAIRRIEDGLSLDLILLDLMMPNMNGWEFCDYRAGSAGLASVPVIVITARRSVTPPLGVSALLLKPFDPTELEDAIARVLAGSSVADGA